MAFGDLALREETKLNWPKRTDIAFGIGTRSIRDDRIVACAGRALAQREYDFRAAGFQKAADIIVESLSEGGNRPFSCDSLFLPVAYLYRHAVELLLKEAIGYGVRLNLITRDAKLQKLLVGHNLYSLWFRLKPALEAICPDGPKDELSAAERIIQQFHEIDKTGQRFRYPMVRGCRAQSEFHESVEWVDLDQLSEVAGGLCNFLGGCISMFDDALSNMPEDQEI